MSSIINYFWVWELLNILIFTHPPIQKIQSPDVWHNDTPSLGHQTETWVLKFSANTRKTQLKSGLAGLRQRKIQGGFWTEDLWCRGAPLPKRPRHTPRGSVGCLPSLYAVCHMSVGSLRMKLGGFEFEFCPSTFLCEVQWAIDIPFVNSF